MSETLNLQEHADEIIEDWQEGDDYRIFEAVEWQICNGYSYDCCENDHTHILIWDAQHDDQDFAVAGEGSEIWVFVGYSDEVFSGQKKLIFQKVDELPEVIQRERQVIVDMRNELANQKRPAMKYVNRYYQTYGENWKNGK